jgi:hypothetical protein
MSRWIPLVLVGACCPPEPASGFPKTSERLGCDSQGNDLPAESLEGVLKGWDSQFFQLEQANWSQIARSALTSMATMALA